MRPIGRTPPSGFGRKKIEVSHSWYLSGLRSHCCKMSASLSVKSGLAIAMDLGCKSSAPKPVVGGKASMTSLRRRGQIGSKLSPAMSARERRARGRRGRHSGSQSRSTCCTAAVPTTGTPSLSCKQAGGRLPRMKA